MNQDSLSLRGIALTTHIGVPDAERSMPQTILVDIELFHPTKPVAETDDVRKGLNYADITAAVQELASVERKTIERLAEDIATCILTRWKPKGGVKVTVTKKPELPLESASLTIHRP